MGESVAETAPLTEYRAFIARKSQIDGSHGFTPRFMPSFMFDFQQSLVTWAVEKGRAAIFADCGMGKTPMQLVWGQNVVEHTNKPVLVLTPLAVAEQTVSEASKFGIDAVRSSGAVTGTRIHVANY
jgi:hypothetical protein